MNCRAQRLTTNRLLVQLWLPLPLLLQLQIEPPIENLAELAI